MYEGTVGLLVLLGCGVAASVISHLFVKRYLLACLVAAILGDVAFQVATYVHEGQLDPFFAIALITAFVVCFAIALLIGIPFHRLRSRRPVV